MDSRGLLNLPSDKSGSWFINFESYSDKTIADIRSKEIRDALVAVDISVVEGQAASGDTLYIELEQLGFLTNQKRSVRLFGSSSGSS